MLGGSRAKIARAKHKRGRRSSVKMARRVGGGTRRATFENQSVFFRIEPTLEALYNLYKTKFWNRDSYVRLNSLFETCTNSTEKARSKNRRTDKLRTLSSVGRALRLHRKCRGFESLSVHRNGEFGESGMALAAPAPAASSAKPCLYTQKSRRIKKRKEKRKNLKQKTKT